MRYALVDGQRAEAAPKLRGTCQNCRSEMIAKCGRVKVWHWAHKGRPPCDPWWESETEWHRAWKDKFPAEWQEVGHTDPATGEKHIADIKNPFGLVIELQHSPIDPAEMRAREAFYGEMIWIVDGTRNLDASYFHMGLSGRPAQDDPLIYVVEWWSRSRLLHNWAEATAKVYLDFGDATLWRLLRFDADKKRAAVGPIGRDTLVVDCKSGVAISILAKDEGD